MLISVLATLLAGPSALAAPLDDFSAPRSVEACKALDGGKIAEGLPVDGRSQEQADLNYRHLKLVFLGELECGNKPDEDAAKKVDSETGRRLSGEEIDEDAVIPKLRSLTKGDPEEAPNLTEEQKEARSKIEWRLSVFEAALATIRGKAKTNSATLPPVLQSFAELREKIRAGGFSKEEAGDLEARLDRAEVQLSTMAKIQGCRDAYARESKPKEPQEKEEIQDKNDTCTKTWANGLLNIESSTVVDFICNSKVTINGVPAPASCIDLVAYEKFKARPAVNCTVIGTKPSDNSPKSAPTSDAPKAGDAK